MKSIFDRNFSAADDVFFSLNKNVEIVGSVCTPGECIDISLAAYEESIGADCTVFPELCALWEAKPCVATSALAQSVEKECPIDYIWSCRSNQKPSEWDSGIRIDEYACKSFSIDSLSYFLAFEPDNHWASQPECEANCKCSEKAFSGATGTCSWLRNGGTNEAEVRCQTMTKGECEHVETDFTPWYLPGFAGPGFSEPQRDISQELLDAGGSRLLNGAIWSCADSCGDCPNPQPDCGSFATVRETYANTSFGGYEILTRCVCEEKAQQCGTYPDGDQWAVGNGYCSTCEFCKQGMCYNCNDVNAGQNLANYGCPTGAEFDAYCACNEGSVPCDTCQFCHEGKCYDCGRDWEGNTWESSPYASQFPERTTKCSTFCQAPDRNKCYCTFRTTFSGGQWTMQEVTSSDLQCGYNIQTTYWESVDDCNTKTWVKEVGKCDENGCANPPSSWQYPNPYSGPAPSETDCKRYNCSDEACVETENGDYLGLTKCQKECEKVYKCEWVQQDGQYTKKCTADYENGYMSKTECEQFTDCPSIMYACTESGGTRSCKPDPSGEFYTEEECLQAVEAGSCAREYWICTAGGVGNTLKVGPCYSVTKSVFDGMPSSAKQWNYISEPACLADGCENYTCSNGQCVRISQLNGAPSYGIYGSPEECSAACRCGGNSGDPTAGQQCEAGNTCCDNQCVPGDSCCGEFVCDATKQQQCCDGEKCCGLETPGFPSNSLTVCCGGDCTLQSLCCGGTLRCGTIVTDIENGLGGIGTVCCEGANGKDCCLEDAEECCAGKCVSPGKCCNGVVLQTGEVCCDGQPWPEDKCCKETNPAGYRCSIGCQCGDQCFSDKPNAVCCPNNTACASGEECCDRSEGGYGCCPAGKCCGDDCCQANQVCYPLLGCL